MADLVIPESTFFEPLLKAFSRWVLIRWWNKSLRLGYNRPASYYGRLSRGEKIIIEITHMAPACIPAFNCPRISWNELIVQLQSSLCNCEEDHPPRDLFGQKGEIRRPVMAETIAQFYRPVRDMREKGSACFLLPDIYHFWRRTQASAQRSNPCCAA
jgi:hypothetical protein